MFITANLNEELENRDGYIEMDTIDAEVEDLFTLIKQPKKMRDVFRIASKVKGTTNRQRPCKRHEH